MSGDQRKARAGGGRCLVGADPPKQAQAGRAEQRTADQQQKVKGTLKPQDRYDAAEDYAEAQAKSLGAKLDPQALRLAIEAHVGHSNTEKA